MKNAILLLSVLIIGIFLFGCVKDQVIPGGDDNITVQSGDDTTVQSGDDTTVQPGSLDFSVPSELPTAYVGKPFSYSINPTGGESPYYFSYYYHGIAYDGSACGSTYDGYSCGGSLEIPFKASATQLSFTPDAGNEGEYVLDVCVSDNTREHRYNPVCKNTTLYVMSDTITVKGSGKVTSSLMWDPRALVTVRGKGDTAEDSIERRSTLLPLSEISSVNLDANLPPKDNDPGSPYSTGISGGGSISFEMTANSTSISLSATGDSPCGTRLKSGASSSFNQDSFQAVGSTDFGLNIINDGTADKVVDISMAGRSAVSSDSTYYDDGGTQIRIGIGDTSFTLNAKDENMRNAVAPGSEITDSKVVRVVVEPGNHVLQIGGIEPYFYGGMAEKDCPTHLGISSGVTVTIADADLSDGKLPTERIYTWFDTDSEFHTEVDEIE